MLLFVNDLTVMDFSYLCEKRGLVGESWIVDVVLDGDLNDEGMVLDFALLKRQLKCLIDEYLDYKLLVPLKNPVTTVQQTGGNVLVDFERASNRSIHFNCPHQAYALISTEEINVTSVADYLQSIIASELPVNVQGLQISLRTEEINSFYYQYSHGLKKHDGNCQRIAHGHRSKIIIEQDGKRSETLAAQWSQRWQNIYIGSEEDILDLTSLNLSEKAKRLSDERHIGFGYAAAQGRFEMLMPRSECEVIKSDSTVECLAQFITQQLKREKPDSHFKVLAYEGVGKGAIAFSE